MSPGDARTEPLQGIKRFWEDVRARAELPAIRIHDHRHAFTSLRASGGMTLPMIGKLLGYKQVQTTQRYTTFSTIPYASRSNSWGTCSSVLIRAIRLTGANHLSAVYNYFRAKIFLHND